METKIDRAKKIIFFIFLFFLFSCITKQTVMTKNDFAVIERGSRISNIEKKYGKPFRVFSKGTNSEIYEYIERISINVNIVAQRRYYLVVSNGKVVDKYLKISNPPPYKNMYSDDPYPEY